MGTAGGAPLACSVAAIACTLAFMCFNACFGVCGCFPSFKLGLDDVEKNNRMEMYELNWLFVFLVWEEACIDVKRLEQCANERVVKTGEKHVVVVASQKKRWSSTARGILCTCNGTCIASQIDSTINANPAYLMGCAVRDKSERIANCIAGGFFLRKILTFEYELVRVDLDLQRRILRITHF